MPFLPNYPYSYWHMHTRDTILHIQQHIIRTKAQFEISIRCLEDFSSKDGKSAKNA